MPSPKPTMANQLIVSLLSLVLLVSLLSLVLFMSLYLAPLKATSRPMDENLTSLLLTHYPSRPHLLSHQPDIPATTTRCARSGAEGSCVFFHAILDVRGNTPEIHVQGKANAPALGLHAGGANMVPITVKEDMPTCTGVDYGMLAIVGQYEHGNHGHVLGDEVWAAWQALVLWGFELEATSLHIVTNDRSPSLQQYEALIADAQQVHTLNELRHRHPSGLVCVGRLLVGMARLGYSQGMTCPAGHRGIECRAPYLPEFKSTFRAFRIHALQNLGVSPKRQPKAPFDVLIVEKNFAVHRIANVPDLVAGLKTRLPDAHVATVRWTDTTMREQVFLVSQADALVSLPGSDLMAAVWLRPDAEILQPCRFVEGVWDAGNEQQIWFRMSHPITVWCDFQTHGGSDLHLPVAEFVERVAAIGRRVMFQ